jgi:hypothetical protein
VSAVIIGSEADFWPAEIASPKATSPMVEFLFWLV